MSKQPYKAITPREYSLNCVWFVGIGYEKFHVMRDWIDNVEQVVEVVNIYFLYLRLQMTQYFNNIRETTVMTGTEASDDKFE